MGDRYILTVTCKCGFTDTDVWYAPTSGFLTFKCPKCRKITDLEEYSGIDAEGTANTPEGAAEVRRMLKERAGAGQ